MLQCTSAEPIGTDCERISYVKTGAASRGLHDDALLSRSVSSAVCVDADSFGQPQADGRRVVGVGDPRQPLIGTCSGLSAARGRRRLAAN